MGIFGQDNSSSDTPDFSFDLSEPTPSNNDLSQKELDEFLLREKEIALIHSQILEYNNVCLEKCHSDVMGNKLNKKAEACLNNCIDRFFDASLFIINRYAANLKKNSI